MIPWRHHVSMNDAPDRGDTLEKLRVWQRALDLMVECHLVSGRLPLSGRGALRDQLERSSSAIAANIAEGHGRARPREFLHSLDMLSGLRKSILRRHNLE